MERTVALIVLVLCFIACTVVEGHSGKKWQKDELERKNNSLTCYVCNSLYDYRCGDPFNDYSLGYVTCAEKDVSAHLLNRKPVVCRKTVQIVQGKTRIIRDCGYIPDQHDNKQCARRTGTHDVLVYYCSCTTSFCNSALGITSAPFVLLLGLFLLLRRV